MSELQAAYYCQENKVLEALGILRKMSEAKMELPGDAWRPLVSRLIKDGYKEDALKVVEIAKQSGADVSQVQNFLDKHNK